MRTAQYVLTMVAAAGSAGGVAALVIRLWSTLALRLPT